MKNRRAYVIGSPIKHSISPAIHNAAFAATGFDARYDAIEVAPDALGDWVRSVRVTETLGFNVTLPHKVNIRRHLDAVEGDAELAGAVNAVVASGTAQGVHLVGTNTDTVGFRRLLSDDADLRLRDQRVLLLGAGGGARAVALVALQDRATQLWVANRHPERARALLADLKAIGLETRSEALALDDPRVVPALREASIVINATSVGLAGEELPMSLEGIRANSVAVDLIYNPLQTAFLREAQRQGARPLGGLGMLVYQAAAAFERWTATEAPVQVMRAAAERALAHRGQL